MASLIRTFVMLAALNYVQCQLFDIFQNFNQNRPGQRIEDIIVFPDQVSFLSKPLNEYDNDGTNRHMTNNKQTIRHEDSTNTPHTRDRNNNNNIPKRKQSTQQNYSYFTTESNFRSTVKDSSHRYDSIDYKPKVKEQTSGTGSTKMRRDKPNSENGNYQSDRNYEAGGTWKNNAANNNTSSPNTRSPPNHNTRLNKPNSRPQYHTTQRNHPKTGIDHDTKIYDYKIANLRPDSGNNFNTATIRPGVRPANVDPNQPPITNKPPSNGESEGFEYNGDANADPTVVQGVDTDIMRTAEKRRYIELAERMCDKYKALSVKRIEAIPLLPSPDPVAINVSSCRPANVPLVVGGRVATIKEFPHMALVGWTKKVVKVIASEDRKIKTSPDGGYSWKCGGSLISDRFVLTAAHCTYYDKDDSVVSFIPRVVQLGSSYRDDGSAQIVKVHSITQHPKYMRRRTYYDVALLKLARSVIFSDTVKPACLGEPPGPGKPVIATGWGRTETSSTSLELRSVSVTVWDINECRQVLGSSLRTPEGFMSDNQMCAGEKNGGKDTCVGDSGGPVQIQDGCTWRVVAVTSGGKACGAPQTPAWYAVLNKAFIAAEVFNAEKDSNRNKDKNAKDTEEHYTGIIDDDHMQYDTKPNQNTREEYVNSRKPVSGLNRGVEYVEHDLYSNKPDTGIKRDSENDDSVNSRKYNNNFSRPTVSQINESDYGSDAYYRNSEVKNRFDNTENISSFDNSRTEYKVRPVTSNFNTNNKNKYNNQRNRGFYNIR